MGKAHQATARKAPKDLWAPPSATAPGPAEVPADWEERAHLEQMRGSPRTKMQSIRRKYFAKPEPPCPAVQLAAGSLIDRVNSLARKISVSEQRVTSILNVSDPEAQI
jgi:hypothetical protein